MFVDGSYRPEWIVGICFHSVHSKRLILRRGALVIWGRGRIHRAHVSDHHFVLLTLSFAELVVDVLTNCIMVSTHAS